MPIVESDFAPLQIPRLAALATSAWPAWLWSADASRIRWANGVGAAIFGAARAAEIGKSRFAADDASAAQIARLAATLPPAGQERLERLRGFGAGFGRALTCACSRLVMPDGTAAILVAAAEPAGPPLPLAERVRRLFAEGGEEALAAFAPDGALLHATAAARQRLNGATTLSALGIEALAAGALDSGHASGAGRVGQTSLKVSATRLGKDATRVVMVALPPAAEAQALPPAASATSAASREAIAQRRHPLRFVWQMDADGHFIVGSDEFIELVGPRVMAACGRSWNEIAAELRLDPDNQVARAIATRETWSGIRLSWPVDETDERLPVELSGLPVFNRDRAFGGYRGFGVCRDVARINEFARARRMQPIGFMPAPNTASTSLSPSAPTSAPSNRGETEPAETPSIAAAVPAAAAMLQPAEAPEAVEPAAQEQHPTPGVAAAAANVVPFRAGPAMEAKSSPSLSPIERNAFRELAQELTARLRGTPDEAALVGGEWHLAAPTSAATDLAPATAPAAAEIAPAAFPIAAAAQGMTPPVAGHALLDRVPAGVLVYRNDSLVYGNRHFLELSGYDSVEALAAAGGLNALFEEPGADALTDSGGAQKLSIKTRRGDKLPVEGRLFSVPWNGAPALALVLTSGAAEARQQATQLALDAAQNEIRDLKTVLDRTARREEQKAAAAKADFLAKISHEIRTPLNSMIGFAEVILAERFGSIGNERYREYLKDMHAAGTHLVSLLNDLLDLSKIETGQLDLSFTDVDLNDLTQQCVAIMQPQANRARIIIRSALTPGLPQVVADARSLRQIVLNLLGSAIKFTGPGGQVIVSTAIADGGEAVLRVRDTGVGMRQTDIDAVLAPFRHDATSAGWGPDGSGLGLPLTKALAEANRANFSIKSAPNAGTLIEIAFPSSRAAAS